MQRYGLNVKVCNVVVVKIFLSKFHYLKKCYIHIFLLIQLEHCTKMRCFNMDQHDQLEFVAKSAQGKVLPLIL